ncbi:efflux RND transporter permease subunit [Waterburya agarophytonicola K14]|uniref:Efflux RND transporter permease subunit n=1 Tax=Waterburya agarophytonicola KI4 TaxID=2874699 RepID=A0A964FF77_9CYAN|nr:efflux RND transporter permease subunit [Waterburya agarophytonicola]MCC0176682.1 efflux RND transporter permease subunit [Waterburya agarophytonicola KI4]
MKANNQQLISAIAIRRHIGTLMLALSAIVLGIFFVFRLPVDLLPLITYPRIGVVVNIPGASPQVALEEVTKPLEEALNATEGLEQIFSETREGRVRLNLYFRPGDDIDKALSDATAIFNRNRDSLPDLVTNGSLFKFDPSQQAIYEFAIESAALDDLALRVFAEEELSRELNIIPGVASVDVAGGVTEEIGINVDLERLQAAGLGFNAITNKLQEGDRDLAGGRLRGEAGDPIIRTVGQWQNIEQIRNLSLDLPDRNLINLSDVARINDGIAEQTLFVTLNGKPAVKISIQKQPDANSIEVINQIKTKIAYLKESGIIPDSITLVTTKDESVFIRSSIANVISAGGMGTVLAAAAVFLFLGSLRQTFIIAIAIPLATLMAILLMKLFALSINIFSLGGLALGVGIVVDNSIVMLENIAERHNNVNGGELGKNGAIDNAIVASAEVESALIASTITNLVSVLPFLLMGGLFSLLFRELILTVSFAIAASLMIALTVVPMMASRLLSIPQSSKIDKFPFLVWFNRQFIKVTNLYGKILRKVIRYRIIIIVLVFSILGSSSYQIWQDLPQEILPSLNTGEAQLYARFPSGTNLDDNRRVMEAAEEVFLRQPETEYVFTSTGGFLFGSSTIDNLLRSSSTITLDTNSDLDAYVERVNQEFDKFNLVDTRLRLSPSQVRGLNLNNAPVSSDLDLILQGKNYLLLEETGEKLLKILDEKATLARYRGDADSKQPEIQIQPNYTRLTDLGYSVTELGSTVQTAVNGAIASQLRREQRLIDIRVQLDKSYRQSIGQLQQLPLLTSNNNAIELSDVAKINLGEAPGEIQRINQRNVFIIAGSLSEGASFNEAMAELKSIIAEANLPSGIAALPSYAEASNQEIQTSLRIMGGLAVFLVFVVMAIQYNSLIDPLIIIFTVPLALAGGVYGLYFTETPISAIVLVGTVLLVGIVVNNAIVMVELANQIQGDKGFTTAIVLAATSRLRPILMTTITTVLGMLPLALGIGTGSELLQPLGIVVFFGLGLATFLTLFIIPCFYVLLHGK